MEAETQYRLHAELSRSGSYLLQCLAGLRRYQATSNKEIVDKFITPDSVRFLDFSLRALEKKAVPYDVSLVYNRITSEKSPGLERENLKREFSALSQLIASIKQGEKPRKDEVETALKFLVKIIPIMDDEVADLGKRLYGSWISVGEGT